jgi:hypothetical protein
VRLSSYRWKKRVEKGLFVAGVTGEAEFAGGAFGEEVVGELEGGSGTGGYGGGADGGIGAEAAEGEEARGFVEAETCAELAGGGAEDAAAKGGVEGAETVELDGDGGLGLARCGADCAASPADGFAGEKDLREETRELGLPAGLFFAGQFGEVGEGLVEAWVVGAELGEEFVADFVAGEGGIGVGGVFAPGVVGGFEEGFDVGAAGFEEGAEDLSFGQRDNGVDGAEAFGPGSAEELHEDGFGLVVEGVGGEDGVGVAGGEEGGEEFVAEVAGGFFDGLGISRGARFGYAGGNVGLMKMERNVEGDAEVFDELLVGAGFFAAEAVVDVDCGEAYS